MKPYEPPQGALALSLAGETVALLPERALWWPRERALFVADVHLGKAASFRALGQPVPSGTTRDNLERLSTLIDTLDARSLVVLGDFLHAATAQQAQVIAPVATWRERHAALRCVLVRGNHDSHAGDPPPALRFDIVDEPFRIGPFAACHHPQTVEGAQVLAGHLHPAVQLRGRAYDRARLPCFCEAPGLLILPAFGAFTGTTLELPARTLCCYATGDGTVTALPWSGRDG
ncbi:ligase-associated DNA damage response endonuclease PdeM [Comamonas endophytica]|uniref:Ligase-associated DNA damage response endonuclease PdeM n=1 Tax=Comamonas endophytica TaxID=2949090 RepID=A0ABY6GHH7_9BURK|nr:MULTISPECIES: ligase-associated DNA damage response endonuclease PdeM [unclassified Acidovorax]MCD2513299.1 ligase-associated DNA damage response endonuclease PdeM [Acidovorax sp. D4N7]UYG53914.1 ligase-associated DNA damage response endonuclease PdeM [Acidovorax sp. 5MLIR]